MVALATVPVAMAFAQVTIPSDAGLHFPTGSALGMACTGLDVSGTISLETSQVQRVAGIQIEPSGTLDAGDGTVTVSGDWVNSGTFAAGTGSVIFNDACAVGPIVLTGVTVFNNLTLSSLSGRTFVLPEGSHITVTGRLTLQGTPAMPIQLASSGGGTAVVNLGPGAQVVRSNVQVGTNVQIGAVAVAVPTLSEVGRAAAAALLALVAAAHFRRRSERA